MTRKLISIIITFAIISSVLAGCNRGNKPTSINSSKPGSISSESKSSSSDSQSQSTDSSNDSSIVDSDWGVSEDSSLDEYSDSYSYTRPPLPTNLISSASSSPNTYIEGLLNASIVGIDKNSFLNEIKYKSPSTVDYVIKATDHGVIANDKKDDTIALQKAIALAKSKPATSTKKIVLPAGDLDFVEGFNSLDYRYGIVITDIDNLSFEGANTQIYFHAASLGFKGFHIVNCKNILLTKFSVDWGIPPYSMGVVESFDATAKYAVIKVNSSYVVNANTKVIEYLEYDQSTNLPRDNGNFLYNHNDVKNIKSVEYLGNNKLKVFFNVNVTKAPVGTRVALAHAMHFSESFIIEKCEDVKFETVNLFSSPGMGLKAYTCTNLYFNRFNCVTKPGTDRLLTVTADILHLKNTKGEIIITNSTLENSHDDAVNVGGHYLRIQEISGNRIRVLSPLGMWGTFKPSINDVYEASDISSLEVKKTITVTKVEDSNDGYWITLKEGATGLVINNALANITRTPKLVFKNNLVRNKRNRGILVQTRNVLIENNAFSNVRNGAIQLLSEVNIFNESTAPKDVVIRNNKFVNNNHGADADIGIAAYGPGFSIGSPLAISNITIENNFMAYSSNAALAFKGVSNIKVRGNLIYNPATNPMEGRTNTAILLENVKDLVLDGNKIFGGTEFGYKSVFVSGGVDVESISLSGNIGINREDIFGVQTNIEIGKSNANINLNDTSLADWNNVGSLISMNACTNINVNEVKLNSVPASDFSQTTKFMWKDDGIYFSFDVKDQSIQFNPNQWWLGDGMELFVTTETKSYGNTGAVKLTNDDTMQLFIKPQSAGGIVFFDQRTSDTVLAKKSQMIFKIWTDASGYKGEGFIPFTSMPGVKASILSDKAIAISVNFGDSDAGDEEVNPLDKFMTFSTVRHPTTENKMIPANMTKFIFKK